MRGTQLDKQERQLARDLFQEWETASYEADAQQRIADARERELKDMGINPEKPPEWLVDEGQ